jgi:hypothetical protein
VALDVDPIAISGEWIRHAPHHSDLLGHSAEPTDGRWQRGDVVRGLYLADEPDTAVAEWYRYLAERGLPPSAAIPHDHHVWRVDLTVADPAQPSDSLLPAARVRAAADDDRRRVVEPPGVSSTSSSCGSTMRGSVAPAPATSPRPLGAHEPARAGIDDG